MKRGLCVFSMILCVMMWGLPALAADREQTEIDVLARRIQQQEACTAPMVNGTAGLELPDGTMLTVEGIKEAGLQLAVYLIPGEDYAAWDWIEQCMRNFGTRLYPMEIYFTDEQGNRVNVSERIAVSVSFPDTYLNPAIFYLPADGSTVCLESRAAENRIVFFAEHSGIYVLAEKEGIGETAVKEENAQTVTGSSVSPRTGDTAWPGLCVLLLTASGAALAAGRVRNKKHTGE